MLITTNQINLIRDNKPNMQFKRNHKPVKECFEDNLNKVKYTQAELLKAKIREFMKDNRASMELCEELIIRIDKYQGVE